MIHDLVVIGGGAAGFYAAAILREQSPKARILILERGKEVLTKVKVSGGGRCNVTHAAFEVPELSTNYPRGQRELVGPFYHYGPLQTLEFFERRGVQLKTEEDGRIFPVSDQSQTIIDCLVSAASGPFTEVLKGHSVQQFQWNEKEELWRVQTKEVAFTSRYVLVATGSNPKIWDLLSQMNLKLVDPVPSLFTFRIKDALLEGLAGISQEVSLSVVLRQRTAVEIPNRFPKVLEASGPLLITHKGVSGPAVLRLSAWGALPLYLLNYQFQFEVNWLPQLGRDDLQNEIEKRKSEQPKKQLHGTPLSGLTKRLWQRLCKEAGIVPEHRWVDLNGKQVDRLIEQLQTTTFQVNGKNTFKEEFVTAGGVDLKEIDFKRFESKKWPGLYFAGEVLNIDAITGGFNFQNAWTGAYLAALSIAEKSNVDA